MTRSLIIAAVLVVLASTSASAQTNERMRLNSIPGLQVRSVAPAQSSIEQRLAQLEANAGRDLVAFEQTEENATSAWNDNGFNQALNDQRANEFCQFHMGDRHGRQVAYTRVGNSGGATYFSRVLCEARPSSGQ